jgi:23S rRNA pseudouridine1911/1915/1917 synthase
MNERVVEKPAGLLEFLFAAWPEAKRKQVRTWLKVGAVTIDGRAEKQFDRALRPGQRVAILARGVAVPETRIAGGLRIRHEDTAVIVIDKPAGLLTIASAAETERTAYAFLTGHVRGGDPHSRDRVWIVHRLDRETSGVMVFARTETAKQALQQNWDAADKRYFAVVEGVPEKTSGVLEHWLDETDPLRVRVASARSPARQAATEFRVAKTVGARSLLELTLRTGRRHQIRVQLAASGWPIVGDKRYGARTDPIRRLALHASFLRFTHPVTGKMMRFESPLPGELGALVAGG